MLHQTVVPTETPSREGSTFDHPAFGQISASRVQSSRGIALYGSDFLHSAFITLRIARSSMDRSLSRDWHHERNNLIEINLSEAQWATFVSSLNVSSGVPCTLDRVAGVQMPAIAYRTQASHFRAEVSDTVGAAIRDVETALAEINDAKNITAAHKRSLGDRLRAAAQHLRANLPFVAQSFDKHVERNVERAKAEINAYATQQRLIGGAMSSPLALEPPTEEGNLKCPP